jgi:hypothetical protein
LSPGPGNYKVEKFANENKGPKFGFGKESRDKFSKSVYSGPGPGFYNEKKVLGEGVPGYSMKDRRKDCRVLPGKDAPGAGNYNPEYNYSKKSTSQYSFGKTSKSKIANIYGNTPPPNQYKPTSNFVKSQSAAYVMGSGKRPALSRILANPGPGSYSPIRAKRNGPSFSAKPKMYIKDSPGPANYSPDGNNVKTKAPGYSMGTESKATISAKPLNKFIAGPGQYQSKSSFEGRTSFSFGSSKRPEYTKEGNPGPGSYKIPTKVSNLEQYSLAKTQFSYV